jgi:hypothetical protein
LSGCTVGQIDRETGTRNMHAVPYDDRHAGAVRGLIETSLIMQTYLLDMHASRSLRLKAL